MFAEKRNQCARSANILCCSRLGKTFHFTHCRKERKSSERERDDNWTCQYTCLPIIYMCYILELVSKQ